MTVLLSVPVAFGSIVPVSVRLTFWPLARLSPLHTPVAVRMSPPLLLRFGSRCGGSPETWWCLEKGQIFVSERLKLRAAIRRIYTVLPTGELAMGLVALIVTVRALSLPRLSIP